MATKPDVLIIGGGLAGLAAGIHLRKKKISVTIIEKASYPKHKVCGEYISNEIVPYLRWLGVEASQLGAVNINTFEFSSGTGKNISAKLPLGGFGISRYRLDYHLYQKAIDAGCVIIEANVTDVSFVNDEFTIKAADVEYNSKIVLGAYGKRSNVDQVLSRDFIHKKSPWLAVKAHYKGNFPDNVVALHSFSGGYCGVSKVENDVINICYLADYETFKKYKDIEAYQTEVLCENPEIKQIFENSTMLFEKSLTISQVSFNKKQPVENHILMIGDTAGLIHPLCGNGMAMAIHSAKIASESVIEYHKGNISRVEFEQRYMDDWQRIFNKRLLMGRILGGLLRNKTLTSYLMSGLAMFPSLLPKIIKQTHGKPIENVSL